MAPPLVRRISTTAPACWQRLPDAADCTTETDALVRALSTMAGNLPIAILQLREDEMPPKRQRAFGALLIELGTLVQQHADLIAPTTTAVRGATSGP